MKLEWTNIRDYRKVGNYEYLKVYGVIKNIFGRVKNRIAFNAFCEIGDMHWKDMETGMPLECSGLLRRFCNAFYARENLINAEIAEAEAKRAEQERSAT